ncbi:MAG: sensor domain-containing diguanylate cyclase [Granulosicoccaceae bacterium]
MLLLAFAGCSFGAEHGSAVQGVLDMSRYADDQGVTALSGEWLVNWDQLLSPADSRDTDQLFVIPNNWNTDQALSKARPGQGYATFTLRLLNIPKDKFWGFSIPEQSTAFKLFVDDKLVASGGQVATQRDHAQAYHGVQLFKLGELPESALLTLQMSNFHHSGGGPWGVISLGPYNVLYSEYLTSLFKKSIIFALVLIASIFLFMQWLIDRREVTSLVLFLFAVIISLRLGIFGVQPLYQIIEPLSWGLHIRVLYLSKLLAPPLLVCWFARVYPKDFNPTIIKFIIAVFSMASVFVLITDPLVFTRQLDLFLLLIAASIGYGLTGIARLVWNRRPGGASIALGTLALVACTLHDILAILQFIDTDAFYFAPGMLAFLLSLMVNLVYLRANEKNKVETLSRELQLTNRSLESNVMQRTRELAEKAKALEEANEKLQVLANIDGLTQVLNRRAFIEQCELFSRTEPRVAIILIDVDHFKQVNDTYGHAVGDEVLVRLGQLLGNITRPIDRVGRFGGEEFVVLLQDFGTQSVQRYCERLLAKVRELDFSDCSTLSGITISAGTVTGVLKKGQLDQFLQTADAAMYQVKANGRNNFALGKL